MQVEMSETMARELIANAYRSACDLDMFVTAEAERAGQTGNVLSAYVYARAALKSRSSDLSLEYFALEILAVQKRLSMMLSVLEPVLTTSIRNAAATAVTDGARNVSRETVSSEKEGDR